VLGQTRSSAEESSPGSNSVSVVISTRDRWRSLRATLECVRRLAIPLGWSTELLVVDNGSSDDTNEVSREGAINGREARVLIEPKPGVSRARNRGAAAASGRIVLFLDDDVRPPRHWLIGLASPIARGAVWATVSQFRLGHDRPWLTELDRTRLMSELSIDPVRPFLVGGSMGIRRDIFLDLGGFEEELGPGALGPGGEDLLLTYRVEAAGGRIAFVDDVEALHLPEERKLQRRALDERLIGEARSEAWLAYHWFGRSDRLPRGKAALLRGMARLVVGRRQVPYAVRAAWHSQMATEQLRERKYPPSHGPHESYLDTYSRS
jgi:glycosyltransferase involved in cell wall biosynthesis